MPEDRFAVVAQLVRRCVRSARRVFNERGKRIQANPTRRGSNGSTVSGDGQVREKTPYECTSEPTPLEVAVLKILPQWPEALEAVLACARELSGIELPPDWGGGKGGARDGQLRPVST